MEVNDNSIERVARSATLTFCKFCPGLFCFCSFANDDLSAFGSSIVFCWFECHSGTRLGGWLSKMKHLSYLIFYCLNRKMFYRVILDVSGSLSANALIVLSAM
jgi:hypothetical protein